MNPLSTYDEIIKRNKQEKERFALLNKQIFILFQSRMRELVSMLRNAIEPIQAEMEVVDIYLNADLPYVHHYPLPEIRIRSNVCHIKVLPKFTLIAGGAKGVVSLLRETSSPISNNAEYRLFMSVPGREKEGWVICNSSQRSYQGVKLSQTILEDIVNLSEEI